MHVSYSQVSTYLRCPFAHYLSYKQGLTPKKPARPLFFGSDFHKLLELRGNKPAIKAAMKGMKEVYYDMNPMFQSELGETYIEDLKTIFTDYCKAYKSNPLPDVTEQRFEITLGKYKGEPIYFVGVIDGLYKQDRMIVEEHKTFSRKPDMNTLVMNVQKCLYAKAVQKIYGSFPDAVMWDYIKSTPAKEPVWLEKSKRLSTAKSEYITPFSWLRACKRHGITDTDTLKLCEIYTSNVQNFFFRYTLDYVPEMIGKVWKDFVYVTKEILSKGDSNQTMNITRDCSWCSFQPICYAMCTGGDVKYTIEKDYQYKEERKREKETIRV